MSGLTRVLFSRFFSLIYIIIVVRLIAKVIMDQMIVLATGHLIIIQITIFGLDYACQQKALSSTAEKSDQYQYNTVIFLLIIAIPLSMLLSFPVAYFTFQFQDMELYLTYPLSLALLVIKEVEVIIERSSLAVDKALFINMTYSILNSLLVPIFFLLTPTLGSVIWAWNISLVITILVDFKAIIRVLHLKPFQIETIKELLIFVLPLYLAALPRPFANNLNNLIIYENLEEGATSVFYWPNRILTIVSEFISIVLSGVQEMFTQIRVQDRIILRDSFLAVFRVLLMSSSVMFFMIFLNAEILINILLGPDYSEATTLMRLLCFAWIFMVMTNALASLKGAEAHRKIMVKANTLNLISKVVLLLSLIHFGLIGVVISEILNSSLVFLYYSKNTEFLRNNYNFIRIEIFVLITILSAGIFSMIIESEIMSVIFINGLFLGVILIFIYLIRPLTTRDIQYASKIIPERFIWILSWYRPSQSSYDTIERGNTP